jgi:hypothetical protein
MKRELTVKVRLSGSEMTRLDEMRGTTSRAEYRLPHNRRVVEGRRRKPAGVPKSAE